MSDINSEIPKDNNGRPAFRSMIDPIQNSCKACILIGVDNKMETAFCAVDGRPTELIYAIAKAHLADPKAIELIRDLFSAAIEASPVLEVMEG